MSGTVVEVVESLDGYTACNAASPLASAHESAGLISVKSSSIVVGETTFEGCMSVCIINKLEELALAKQLLVLSLKKPMIKVLFVVSPPRIGRPRLAWKRAPPH